MSRPGKAVVLIGAFLSVSSVFAGNYLPGEVLVKYKDGAFRARTQMNALYQSIGATDVRRYSGMMQGLEQITFEGTQSVEEVVATLNQDPSVEYAQPNFVLHAMPITTQTGALDEDVQPKTPCLFPGIPFPPGCGDDTSPGGRPEVRPAPGDVNPPVADPSLSKAYGIEKVSAPAAWEVSKGDHKFVVADIDTGIDYNHEDLAGNLWRNTASASDGIVGYDFLHNDGLPYDDNGHGTHTAGTIGAVGGNGIGVSGVIQKVAIMSLKFLSASGSGSTADAVRAIDYAIAHGAKVLSNSWGGKSDGENKVLSDAIDRARLKDVMFVAAAGNDGGDNDGSDADYPAAFKNENIVAVAATDSNDRLASFSNYGKTRVHLAAPGVNVYSTSPGNKYKSLSGTSMACPHVAGAAALVWSLHPEWTYQRVKQQLMDTVDKVSGLEEKTVTGGRLNVAKAVK